MGRCRLPLAAVAVLADVRLVTDPANEPRLPLALAKEECARPSAPVVDAASAVSAEDFPYPAERELTERWSRVLSLLNCRHLD
jgi:hypothetical protein